MTDGPRLLLETPKFRVVQLANGTKVIEKMDGCDALGEIRWRELRFGETDNVARQLRDWIFEHLSKCPLWATGAEDHADHRECD